jgi:hypothetical protein
MPSPEQDIKNNLQTLGLSGDDLHKATLQIIRLKELLALSFVELAQKNLPRSLAIAKNLQAVQVIDEVTDLVVASQGLLAKAMKGEDIHDSLAVIKASVESLIVGETIQPRTVHHLKTTTERIAKFKREEVLKQIELLDKENKQKENKQKQ